MRRFRIFGLITLGLMVFIVGCTSMRAAKPVSKDTLINEFSRLGFRFDKERVGRQGMRLVSGDLGNLRASHYVHLIISSDKKNIVDNAGMMVWLKGDNTPKNRDLVYLSKLTEKALPGVPNCDEMVREGISRALSEERTPPVVGGNFGMNFTYVTDTGGAKGDNVLVLSLFLPHRKLTKI